MDRTVIIKSFKFVINFWSGWEPVQILKWSSVCILYNIVCLRDRVAANVNMYQCAKDPGLSKHVSTQNASSGYANEMSSIMKCVHPRTHPFYVYAHFLAIAALHTRGAPIFVYVILWSFQARLRRSRYCNTEQYYCSQNYSVHCFRSSQGTLTAGAIPPSLLEERTLFWRIEAFPHVTVWNLTRALPQLTVHQMF